MDVNFTILYQSNVYRDAISGIVTRRRACWGRLEFSATYTRPPTAARLIPTRARMAL